MAHPLENQITQYTYSDYLRWSEKERWELIDGIPYNMSPSPSTTHQRISIVLSSEIYNYLKGKACQVFTAPYDVLFAKVDQKDEDVDTVVQPDILVVCDKNKIDARGCKGAPDFVIEIVSPSTAKIDYIQKMNLYETNGVREYWIVHPIDQIVMTYHLEQGKYGKPIIYSKDDQVAIGIFDGNLVIDLVSVFTE